MLQFSFFLTFKNDASDKKSAVNRARRLRKIGTKLLPPFPNGWYKLATSKEIKPGTAKHIDCIGEHFVVFRSTDSKKIFVLDAYCPHMGASLGENIFYEVYGNWNLSDVKINI